MVAALLRLADGTDAAALVLLGLREAFLDGKPGDRAAAFGDVYRRSWPWPQLVASPEIAYRRGLTGRISERNPGAARSRASRRYLRI